MYFCWHKIIANHYIMSNIKVFLLISFLTLMFCSYSGKSEMMGDTVYSKKEARSIVVKMGDELWALREFDYVLAKEKGIQAIEIANHYGLDNQVARLSNFLGVLNNINLNNSEIALTYFHKAMELSLRLNDSIQLAYAYNNLADIFFINENIQLSLEYTLKSLEIFEHLKYEKGIAYAYVNLGAIHEKEKKYDLALKDYNTVLKIRETQNDTLGLSQIWIEIANTYLQMGNLEKALSLYSESYEQFIKMNNILYSATSLLGIGNVYYEQGRMQESIGFYFQAKELYLKNNNKNGLIKCYHGMALAYGHIGDKEKGEEALGNSRILSEQAKLRPQLLNNHKYEAEFYQIIGDSKEALKSLSQYIVIHDSVLSLQKIEIVDELQKGYEIQQNIDGLQEELKDRESKEFYMVIIMVLMTLVVFVFVWRYIMYQRLNKKLISSVQTTNKLFSVISHDLKSPFNSILGFSKVLIDVVRKKEYNQVLHYAEIINRVSAENLKLLNNLLDWSSSQTGKINYQPKAVGLDSVFKVVQDFFVVDVNKNSIQLNFSSSIHTDIIADTNILRTVLINLISNAIKYTEVGGHIDVIAQIKNSRIMISVVDDGTGMSESTIESLFQPSKEVSVKGVRNEPGTGLGLMICFELIQIHKGSIRVKSEIGEGSTFVISFPVEIVS